MTISSSEIRRNMTIILDDDVYQILDWQHRQAPKAPPTLTLKVRQIKTGNVYERKLQGNQKLTRAAVDTPSVQYLYPDGDMHNFMDTETFEQFAINEEIFLVAQTQQRHRHDRLTKLGKDNRIFLRRFAELSTCKNDRVGIFSETKIVSNWFYLNVFVSHPVKSKRVLIEK